MSDTTREPIAEVAARIADAAAARQVPFLVGVEHQRNMFHDYRRNVRESNDIMNHAAGLSLPDGGDGTHDSSMGDIKVAGDTTTTNHFHGGAMTGTRVIPWIVSAAALAAAAWSISTRPNAAPGPADAKYEVLFYDASGNLIDMPRR